MPVVPECARLGADVSSSRYRQVLKPASDGLFDKVYRKEQPRLKRYFDWKAGPEVSQDLVQDVFARALSGNQRDQLENPTGYLWRIAQNLLVDTVRKRKRQPAEVEFDEAQHWQPAPDQTATLEAAQLQRRYEKALTAMPTRTREVFLMHRLDERTYKEIARALGITCAGVEYHMSKALIHLAGQLGVER